VTTVDVLAEPTPLLYGVLGLLTAGFGVGMLIYQTGSTPSALTTRRGMLGGGVLLIIVGGVVLLTQVWAILAQSYAHIP
jgi:high-affinity Fe2+/Pb2+ permease